MICNQVPSFYIPFNLKMFDPFFPPPGVIVASVKPLSDLLDLQTLPFHIHEVVIAFCFYTIVDNYGSQIISSRLFPKVYSSLSHRNKIGWNIHFVSFVQSTLICALALWVLWKDEERWRMDWKGRIWGYTGAGGLVQAFAMGYFLWDVMVSIVHLKALGLSSLIHAICALAVVGIGFVSLFPCKTPFKDTSTTQGYNFDTGFSETLCELLWSKLHTLRTFHPISQHPLVL